jgi:hypothetical protein
MAEHDWSRLAPAFAALQSCATVRVATCRDVISLQAALLDMDNP